SGSAVNPQNAWALTADPLACQQTEKRSEPTLDGSAGDVFPPPQAAAADAVKVFLTNRPPETLAGPQPRQNPRKTLPEGTFTPQASPLPGFHFQNRPPFPPAFVSRTTYPAILQPQLGFSTVG